MVAEAAAELSGSVRAVFTSVAEYLELVTRNNPYRSASALVSRPDVDAVLRDAFTEARDRARQAVQDAWGQHAPVTGALLAMLLADVDHGYNEAALEHLRGDIRHAYWSVSLRLFTPGVSAPGTNPARESVAERAAAVREAVEAWGRRAALHNSLSVDVALGDSRTLAEIEEAGTRIGHWVKRWRTSKQPPDENTCYWCRRLNGVTLPLHASFAHHLGGPADLSGHGHLTQPPHPYHGWLQGPQLHPGCRCRLEFLPAGAVQQEGGQEAGVPLLSPVGAAPPPAPFLAAAQIRAMPEDRYQALLAFLRAAVHELGQVLHRLGRVLHGNR